VLFRSVLEVQQLNAGRDIQDESDDWFTADVPYPLDRRRKAAREAKSLESTPRGSPRFRN